MDVKTAIAGGVAFKIVADTDKIRKVARQIRDDARVIKSKIIPCDYMFINFSREWHAELIDSEKKFIITDLKSEGIQPLEGGIDLHNRQALKLHINKNEKVYVRIPVTGFTHSINASIHMYLTGTVTARLIGGDVGAEPVAEHQEQWVWLAGRSSEYWGFAIELNGGMKGGDVYIKDIALWDVTKGNQEISSFPNPALNGSEEYTYDFKFLNMDGIINGSIVAQGDGTNPINIDIYIRTPLGDKKIRSISITANEPTVSIFAFPVKYYRIQSNYPFMKGYLKVYGTGKLITYSIRLQKTDMYIDKIGGLKSVTKSNTNTTIIKAYLYNFNGWVAKFKNGKVTLDGTHGTAKLYINDVLVLDASGTTATFNIPEDLEIWEIYAELAGDGTNPATASLEGIELIGPYIMTL